MRLQSVERQDATYSAEMSSAHGDMTNLKETANVAQHQLASPQSASLIVEGGYRHLFGIEEQYHAVLKVLLCIFGSCLVDRTFILDLIHDLLHQDMDLDLDTRFRVIFTAVLDSRGGFHFATSKVVDTSCATPRQHVSSIMTHVNDRLAPLASESSVPFSSHFLDPDEALAAVLTPHIVWLHQWTLLSSTVFIFVGVVVDAFYIYNPYSSR